MLDQDQRFSSQEPLNSHRAFIYLLEYIFYLIIKSINTNGLKIRFIAA